MKKSLTLFIILILSTSIVLVNSTKAANSFFNTKNRLSTINDLTNLNASEIKNYLNNKVDSIVRNKSSDESVETNKLLENLVSVSPSRDFEEEEANDQDENQAYEKYIRDEMEMQKIYNNQVKGENYGPENEDGEIADYSDETEDNKDEADDDEDSQKVLAEVARRQSHRLKFEESLLYDNVMLAYKKKREAEAKANRKAKRNGAVPSQKVIEEAKLLRSNFGEYEIPTQLWVYNKLYNQDFSSGTNSTDLVQVHKEEFIASRQIREMEFFINVPVEYDANALYKDNSYSGFKVVMTMDEIKLDEYFFTFQAHGTNEKIPYRYLETVILRGTIYNVPAGVHNLHFFIRAYNSSMVNFNFRNSQIKKEDSPFIINITGFVDEVEE